MSAPLICTDRSAVEVKDKSVFALFYVCVCVCVWMSMRGAVRAAESQIWGGLQECSLPLKSLLSVLNKYQAQNEGNVASQGSIQPCFIKGSRSFFSSSCLCCCWGWRGHIHTDEWAGLQAAAQRDIRADRVQDEWITVKLRSVGVMLVFFKGRFS